MRCGFRTLSAAIAVIFLAVPVLAHHAIEGEYDLTRTVTLTGVVSRVEWVNPHAHLYLEVTRGDGTTLAWSIELAPPNALRRSGLDTSALTQGDRVVVDVWAAKDGSQSASIRAITLSDGRTFSNGPPMWTRQSNR
ncbi:MAG: DUF6152 family protein [Gammaproteobacteria bacterium]